MGQGWSVRRRVSWRILTVRPVRRKVRQARMWRRGNCFHCTILLHYGPLNTACLYHTRHHLISLHPDSHLKLTERTVHHTPTALHAAAHCISAHWLLLRLLIQIKNDLSRGSKIELHSQVPETIRRQPSRPRSQLLTVAPAQLLYSWFGLVMCRALSCPELLK